MFFKAPAVPIVPGRYRMRYEHEAIVEITGDPLTGYAIAAVSQVKITSGPHFVPEGTLLAEIRSKGGCRYVGWHGHRSSW